MERTVLYPIKPGCFKPRTGGISNIHIQYCYSSEKKTLLDTKIVIPVSCWDKVNLVITPDLVQRREEVKRQEELEKQKADLNVFDQIEKYIITQTPKVCKDMPRIYRNMRDHLLAYQEARKINITFETFTFDFYEDFVNFLSHEYVQRRRKQSTVGLKINTVGKTINQLRTFLINRAKKKIIQPVDLTDWDVVGEEVDAEYLDWIEIGKMWTVELTEHPHLIPYRADFVLGCLTGLRFSDFSVLEKPDVRGDFLYKKQGKSKHWVVIPLRKIAREILEDRFRTEYVPLSNAEFNRHIKTVAKLAGITQPVKHSYRKGNKWFEEVKPKSEWITSHTCRGSFCTNEFLAGTPVELIMKISGHKSTKDFYRYIRITPEQAAQIIKDIWENRSTMLARDMVLEVGGKGLPLLPQAS